MRALRLLLQLKPVGLAAASGTAASLAIPDDPGLVCLAFFQQVAVPDALANPAGLSWSNSLAARVGGR